MSHITGATSTQRGSTKPVPIPIGFPRLLQLPPTEGGVASFLRLFKKKKITADPLHIVPKRATEWTAARLKTARAQSPNQSK